MGDFETRTSREEGKITGYLIEVQNVRHAQGCDFHMVDIVIHASRIEFRRHVPLCVAPGCGYPCIEAFGTMKLRQACPQLLMVGALRVLCSNGITFQTACMYADCA